MAIAGDQLSTTVLYHGESPEPVVLQFEDPVKIVEGRRPLQERHGLELKRQHEYQNSRETPIIGCAENMRTEQSELVRPAS